jgi:Fur family peroxide stress response transcriptional regulator
MSTKSLNERMIAFEAACERLEIKLTHQRMEIFREVIATEEHPDAVTVHRRVRKRIPTISLDTVYRNLKLLADHGLIAVVGMSQESLRFDGNMEPHHHFSCVKCGRIQDFYSSQLDHLVMPEEARSFGDFVSLHLEVKGICRACRKGTKKG